MEQDLETLRAKADEAAELLASMANAKRLLVLCTLVEGERSAGDLAIAVGLSQSALSQHLSRLRAIGLVKSRREAQSVIYRLSSPEAEELLRTLHRIYCEPATS